MLSLCFTSNVFTGLPYVHVCACTTRYVERRRIYVELHVERRYIYVELRVERRYIYVELHVSDRYGDHHCGGGLRECEWDDAVIGKSGGKGTDSLL